ncbi:hypothetical protein [Anaerovorax odorimutans]|uniref:hypothetical protein n=1 Tax=Anaerovorax odorimutans TaxID=109327 RepID=UPI0012EC03AC|nr:hypothetical protein [Anaerovorax odorimutans]
MYKALESAEMLVLASTIYCFGLRGQLQCVIHRTYAIGEPEKLKIIMIILSSGSHNVLIDGKEKENTRNVFENLEERLG